MLHASYPIPSIPFLSWTAEVEVVQGEFRQATQNKELGVFILEGKGFNLVTQRRFCLNCSLCLVKVEEKALEHT